MSYGRAYRTGPRRRVPPAAVRPDDDRLPGGRSLVTSMRACDQPWFVSLILLRLMSGGSCSMLTQDREELVCPVEVAGELGSAVLGVRDVRVQLCLKAFTFGAGSGREPVDDSEQFGHLLE